MKNLIIKTIIFWSVTIIIYCFILCFPLAILLYMLINNYTKILICLICIFSFIILFIIWITAGEDYKTHPLEFGQYAPFNLKKLIYGNKILIEANGSVGFTIPTEIPINELQNCPVILKKCEQNIIYLGEGTLKPKKNT